MDGVSNNGAASRAEALLSAALRAGAEVSEVLRLYSRSQIACFEANHLKQLESIESEGVALRVWRNQQPGLAVAYGDVDLPTVVEQALALSALNQPQPIDVATTQLCSTDLDRGHRVSTQQLIDWGNEAIERVLADYPDCSCTAEYECELEVVELINSAGMQCGYTDITLSGFLTAEEVQGHDFLCVEAAQVQRDHLNIADLNADIQQRLAWAHPIVPAPLGQVPILFTPKATEVIWSTLQAALNGKQVITGASPWSEGLYTQVTSSVLSLSQIPTFGPYSCPFDDEGMPTRTLEFIRNGELRLFYTDQAMGRLLGCGSTGNGFRPSLGSYPTPDMLNFVIQAGQYSLAQLIQGMENGLIVDQVLGESTSITGELSVNVDLGFRVQAGEVIGRVKDTMVTGNVYRVLQQVLALGNDNQWCGSYYTPSVLVDGLSVTA